MENELKSNNELEQLREQMSAFKERLDKQQIVNEKLVLGSIGTRMSWIKNFIWFEIALLPILLAIMAWFHASEGLSWWLFTFLAIGFVADVIGDYIINRVPKGELLGGDLVATSQRLLKMKKQRSKWFVAGTIFMSIWVVWFIIEIVMKLNKFCNEPDHNLVVGIMVGGLVVGALIGFLIALLILRKMQKTNNQLIEQINQLTSSEKEEE